MLVQRPRFLDQNEAAEVALFSLSNSQSVGLTSQAAVIGSFAALGALIMLLWGSGIIEVALMHAIREWVTASVRRCSLRRGEQSRCNEHHGHGTQNEGKEDKTRFPHGYLHSRQQRGDVEQGQGSSRDRR